MGSPTATFPDCGQLLLGLPESQSAASHREASRIMCPRSLPRPRLETLALLWKFVVQGGGMEMRQAVGC